MPISTNHPHVVLDNGSPVIRGTHVWVRRLWAWHRRGVAVEKIVRFYARHVGWAEVLDGLSYAYDNRELVEADLAKDNGAP